MRIAKPALILTFVFFSAATLCLARDVVLEWKANVEPDVVGYEVYLRQEGQSYDYSDPDWKGPETDCTIYNLSEDIKYNFVVRAVDSEGYKSNDSREVSLIFHSSPLDDGEHQYNAEWEIIDGDPNLQGLKFLFDVDQGMPTIDTTLPLPPIPGVIGAGVPLNLTHSGVPPFDPPVKVYIPCPVATQPSRLNIYLHDNTTGWIMAHDANNPINIVEQGAEGWLVVWLDDFNSERCRENYDYSIPPTVAVKMRHFSGVQAGVLAPTTPISSAPESSGGGGGGCFIAAVSL